MADKLEIEVLLLPDGNVRLVTRGLKGQACLQETEGLERALGTVARREKTSEFWQAATAAKGTVKGR